MYFLQFFKISASCGSTMVGVSQKLTTKMSFPYQKTAGEMNFVVLDAFFAIFNVSVSCGSIVMGVS